MRARMKTWLNVVGSPGIDATSATQAATANDDVHHVVTRESEAVMNLVGGVIHPALDEHLPQAVSV